MNRYEKEQLIIHIYELIEILKIHILDQSIEAYFDENNFHYEHYLSYLHEQRHEHSLEVELKKRFKQST